MRVTCPSCSTVYNIDDKKIPATGANLKCAKCKSSFPVRPAAAAAVPLPGTAPAAPSAVPLPGAGAPPPPAPAPGAVPLPGTDPYASAPPANDPNAVPLPGSDPFGFDAAPPPAHDPNAVPLPGSDSFGFDAAPPAGDPNAVPLPGSDPFGFEEPAAPQGGYDPGAVPLPGAAPEDPFGLDAPADAGGGAYEPVPLPPAEEDPGPASAADFLSDIPGGSFNPVPLPPAEPAADPFGGVPEDPYAAAPAAAYSAPAASFDPFGGAAPEPAVEPPAAPPPASLGFGEMDLGGGELPPPPPPAGNFSFGEVDFGAPPAAAAPPADPFGFDAPPPPAPAPAPAAPPPDDLDFLNMGDAPAPPPMAPPPPSAAPDALEFDPLAAPPSLGGGDDLEADLSAPIPSGPAPSAPAPNDLELLDFIDEAGAGVDKEKGRRSRGSSTRYHIRRKSGKVFGPFDQAAVVKMLGEGQLLGNEDVSTDGESWNPIGSIGAFGEAIQKLMEGPGGMAALGNLGQEEKASAPAETPEEAMARLKSIYGDRMASIAIVDTASAHRDLKKKLPFAALGVVMLLLVAVGVYLGFTPYGYFGMRWLFPKSLKEGTAAWAKYQEASKALGEDTFEGYGKVLAAAEGLLRENDSIVESRALFAQAVFYLERRYSSADDKLPQAKRYLEELELAAREKPEVIKARAGYHLLLGNDADIRKALETSAVAHPEDPEFNFLLVESYLRERNAAEAAKVLQGLLALDLKEAKGKALHYEGLARTMEKTPDYAKALESFKGALEANPKHLSSAVEIAAILVQRMDQPEQSTEHLRRATSEDAKALLSPTERARAHYLMGMVHDARQEPADAEKQFEEALKVYPDSAPAKGAYGRFLLRRRDYEKALGLFQSAYQTDPRQIDYLDGLVRSMISVGKFNTAATTLDGALKDFPSNPRIAFLQGRLGDGADKGDDAERNYKRAIAGDATYWEPSYYLGRFYLRRNRLEEAGKALDEALQKAPRIPETHVGRGEFLLASGKASEAKVEFLKSIEIQRDFGPAHFGLARVLFSEGALEDAKKEFELALETDASQGQLHTSYGTLLWRMGELQKAAEMLEKAKNADARDNTAAWQLGAVLFELGRYDEALKNVESALLLDPSNPDTHFYKARVHFMRHENTQAIEAMKAAMERSSQRPEFHYHMGNMMMQAQRFEQAVERWTEAVKLNPNYADALEALGKGYQDQTMYEMAIGFYEKTLAADPERRRLVMNIADCLYNMARYDQSITKYQEALKVDEKNVAAYFRIGRSYGEKGKLDEAIKWYLQAVKNDTANTEVHRWLGYAYKEKNRRMEAVEAFKKYLEKNPNAGDAADIGNEIYDLEQAR